MRHTRAATTVLALLCAQGHAQPVQTIDTTPGGVDRYHEDPEPIEPTPPSVTAPNPAGLTAGQDWMRALSDTLDTDPAPAKLNEGTFVVSRPGRLVDAPNGRLIFVPDHEQRLPGEGPMLLLPCSTLERLEQFWDGTGLVVLSGEVFVADNRRHLLIVDYALTQVSEEQEDPSSGTDPQDDTAGTDPAPEPGSPSALAEDDPEVAALLSELEATPDPIGRRGRIDGLNDPRAQEPLEAPNTLDGDTAEGDILIRRQARLDRAPDGSWTLVFDHDEPGSADNIKLTLLPCKLTESMERVAIRVGPNAAFIVSGRVYVYKNRGYVLPTFMQYKRPGEIEPWQ